MKVLRVLHVDDEPDIRAVVQVALGLDAAIVCRNVESGQAAIAVATDWRPDVILLDVMMPEMDGPETLSQLRKVAPAPEIPVIFMTARAQPREVDRFFALGAVGVIRKPFDPMTLADSVRAHLNSPHQQLQVLKEEFLVRAASDAVKLGLLMLEAQSSESREAPLAGIENIAHKLAGGAGIYGFADLSDLAANLESVVVRNREGNGDVRDIHVAVAELLMWTKQHQLALESN